MHLNYLSDYVELKSAVSSTCSAENHIVHQGTQENACRAFAASPNVKYDRMHISLHHLTDDVLLHVCETYKRTEVMFSPAQRRT